MRSSSGMCGQSFDLPQTAAALSQFMGVLAGIALPTFVLVVQFRHNRVARGNRSLLLLPVMTLGCLAAAYQYAVIAGEQSCARLALLSVFAAPTLAFVVILAMLLMASLVDDVEADERTVAVALKIMFYGTLFSAAIGLTVNFVDAQQMAGNRSISWDSLENSIYIPIMASLLGAYIREAYRNSARIPPEFRRQHPFFRLFMLAAGAIVLMIQMGFGLAAGVSPDAAEDFVDFFISHPSLSSWIHTVVVSLLLASLTMAYPRLHSERPISPALTKPGERVLESIVLEDDDPADGGASSADTTPSEPSS